MDWLRAAFDKTAIAISFACTLHCLLLPIALVAAPSTALLAIFGEGFHESLILVVLPVSLLALLIGARQHGEWRVILTGLAGILISVASVLLGHDVLGDAGEVIGTLVGAGLIATSHFQNQRCCAAEAAA